MVDFAHGAALILVNLVQLTTMSMVGICCILTPVSCRGAQKTQHNETAIGECGGMVYASRCHTLGCRVGSNGSSKPTPILCPRGFSLVVKTRFGLGGQIMLTDHLGKARGPSLSCAFVELSRLDVSLRVGC